MLQELCHTPGRLCDVGPPWAGRSVFEQADELVGVFCGFLCVFSVFGVYLGDLFTRSLLMVG